MEMQAKNKLCKQYFCSFSAQATQQYIVILNRKKQEHYDEFLYFLQKLEYMELPVNLLSITARKFLLLTNN